MAAMEIGKTMFSFSGCVAGLALVVSPAFAGTVTCAGKVYHDVTYATLATPGYFAVVSLWVGEVKDEDATKRIGPKFTIVLNPDIMCELEDVTLHLVPE
jgi:hypothetical protein